MTIGALAIAALMIGSITSGSWTAWASISSSPAAASLSRTSSNAASPRRLMGVDDQHRPFRKRVGHGRLNAWSTAFFPSPISARARHMVTPILPRDAHAPRPVRPLDPRHAGRASAASERPHLAVVHLRRAGAGGADRDAAGGQPLVGRPAGGQGPRGARPRHSLRRAVPQHARRTCAARMRARRSIPTISSAARSRRSRMRCPKSAC